MKKFASYALAALLLLIVIDVVLSVFNTGLVNERIANRPSYTVAASQARGAFVESLNCRPSAIGWNGKRILIKEAWLEHQTELVRIYVIVPYLWQHRQYRRVEGYNLCLNLADGWDVLGPYPGPFFVAEGKGNGFVTLGRAVLWERWDDVPAFPVRVSVTDNWKFRNSQRLVIEKRPG